MSSRPDEKRYPSVEEFAGWYNLGYQRDDGLPVLQSSDWVPDFEHAEFFDLYNAQDRWFDNLVPASARKPFDPLAAPPFFVRSSADDRTLDVDADCDHLCVDVVKRIQQEFLCRYPLWRIILWLELPSCSIVIYPDAVRYGNLPLDVNPHEALRSLLPRAAELREKRLRPQRAQLDFLRQQLPGAVKGIGDRRFVIAGVRDNCDGDYSRLALFVLIRGADDDAVAVEGPAGTDNDFLWTSSGFGVSAEGIVISHIDVPEAAPFCVALWLLPADYRGQLFLVERATGRRHTYELRSENIIGSVPEG